MQIEKNKFYRFKFVQDKKIWLQIVRHKFDICHDIIRRPEILQSELLRVVDIKSNCELSYRTKFNPMYEKAILYEPDEVEIENYIGLRCGLIGSVGDKGVDGPEGSVFTSVNAIINNEALKNIVKGDKTMNRLIERAQTKAISALQETQKKQREEFIANTVAGKALITAADAMNNASKDVSVKWMDLFKRYMLTDKELEKLHELENQYADDLQAKQDFYLEASELFNLAHDFKDQEKILLKYGAIG